jgi:hypothetical protein
MYSCWCVPVCSGSSSCVTHSLCLDAILFLSFLSSDVAVQQMDYVASVLLYGCFYGPGLCGDPMCLPMLASMRHLWATIRGISFPVTSALSACVGFIACFDQLACQRQQVCREVLDVCQ